MGNDASKKIDNNVTIKWVKDKERCPFPAREGQTSAVIDCRLYLFGGVVFVSGSQNENGQDTETNDLLVYDVTTSSWLKEEPDDTWPTQRSGACMASVGDKLYLFGGLNQYCGWMNDMYVFNTNTKSWKEIKSPGGPSPRDKVLAVSSGTKIYIFGGFGPADEKECITPEDILPEDADSEYEDIEEDEINVMRTQNGANFTWSNQLFVFDTETETWSLMKPTGSDLPTPRAAHCLEYLKDKDGQEWLYVFGGRDSESRQNDLWKYSLQTNKWELCQCFGCPPQPRSFHASAAVESRLIIHGGRGVTNQHLNDFNIFDINTKQWLQPAVNNEVAEPPAMGLHNLCITNDCLVLCGGSSNLDPATGTCTTFYNDVYKVKAFDVASGGAIQSEKDESASMPSALNLKSSQKVEQSNEAVTG